MRRIDELEAQFTRHQTLPREAVIKSDLLRTGIRFEKEALVREASSVDGASASREHQPKS